MFFVDKRYFPKTTFFYNDYVFSENTKPEILKK